MFDVNRKIQKIIKKCKTIEGLDRGCDESVGNKKKRMILRKYCELCFAFCT
jgi:hypothetical protein